MFNRYYCIKSATFRRYFLHYFVLPFANAVNTDYARSRAGSTYLVTAAILWPRYRHNESCVRSRALTARELP